MCTGGGGLLAGVSLGLGQSLPDVRLVGVQSSHAASYPPSLAAGHPVPLDTMSTMADGIAVARPGQLPFGIIERAGGGIPDRRRRADRPSGCHLSGAQQTGRRTRRRCGSGGGSDPPELFEPPLVVTLSGGNVDPLLLLRIVQRGMVAAGRYMVISARIPTSPGTSTGCWRRSPLARATW